MSTHRGSKRRCDPRGRHRSVGLIDGLNALEYDEADPVGAQAREIVPRAKQARVSFLQHLTQSANACCACSSRTRDAQSGNAEHSFVRGGNWRRRTTTGSDAPTRMPMPAAKGRYVVPRSCGRQASRNVSRVTTCTVKLAALARHKADSVTSLLRGLPVLPSGC